MDEPKAIAWPRPGFTLAGTTHTPGPWFSNGTHIRKSLANPRDGSIFIGEIRCTDISLASEQIGNGRLMAAAPVLLDLAVEMAAYSEAAMHDAEEEGDELSRLCWSERLTHCCAVIEAATGIDLTNEFGAPNDPRT